MRRFGCLLRSAPSLKQLRVLTKRGLGAYAACLDLPSRLIACSSGRSQSQ
jgi:hypothetical protein